MGAELWAFVLEMVYEDPKQGAHTQGPWFSFMAYGT